MQLHLPNIPFVLEILNYICLYNRALETTIKLYVRLYASFRDLYHDVKDIKVNINT
jgi:hypothetical protein